MSFSLSVDFSFVFQYKCTICVLLLILWYPKYVKVFGIFLIPPSPPIKKRGGVEILADFSTNESGGSGRQRTNRRGGGRGCARVQVRGIERIF